MGLKIAVLFDGAGLARLGLEQAGHDCTGVELDPWKHHLSKSVGSGNCVLGDATKFDLSGFDGVWASPPCILRSRARYKQTQVRNVIYSVDYVNWCLTLNCDPLWVECTISYSMPNNWGTKYNAAQFLKEPIQIRNRIIGGKYRPPKIFRPYKFKYSDLDVCPAILATEYKCGQRRATQWHRKNGMCPTIVTTQPKDNTRLCIEECAFHQGFEIPKDWYKKPDDYPKPGWEWTKNLYEAVGNGVPVFMAKAFGDMY